MIEVPQPIAPPRVDRRPGFGVAVVRGLFHLSRLYKQYGASGYIPLNEVHGKDRGDIRKAMRYIYGLASWHFWKAHDKRG